MNVATDAPTRLDLHFEPCYTGTVQMSQGRFCLGKAPSVAQIYICAKSAPFVRMPLKRPAAHLDNDGKHERGVFAMFGKVCKKCGQLKFITEFHKNPKTKDGYYGTCKSCCAKYQKAYRKKNKQKLSDDKRKYREENRETVLRHKNEYTASHRTKENYRSIIWQKQFPEKVAERSRLRRFRTRANGGSVSKKQWAELCRLFNYRCAKCGEVKKLEMDHIVSVANGGSGGIENVQPLCRSCNASKNSRSIDYRPAHIKAWAKECATWK